MSFAHPTCTIAMLKDAKRLWTLHFSLFFNYLFPFRAKVFTSNNPFLPTTYVGGLYMIRYIGVWAILKYHWKFQFETLIHSITNLNQNPVQSSQTIRNDENGKGFTFSDYLGITLALHIGNPGTILNLSNALNQISRKLLPAMLLAFNWFSRTLK